jgi:hypothetical protein
VAGAAPRPLGPVRGPDPHPAGPHEVGPRLRGCPHSGAVTEWGLSLFS